MYDLLISGGTVVDPAQGLEAPRDVAIAGGRVRAVAEHIDAAQASQVIDAKGLLVTPGLVDVHVHVYDGVSHYGVDADTYVLPSGVTTASMPDRPAPTPSRASGATSSRSRKRASRPVSTSRRRA